MLKNCKEADFTKFEDNLGKLSSKERPDIASRSCHARRVRSQGIRTFFLPVKTQNEEYEDLPSRMYLKVVWGGLVCIVGPNVEASFLLLSFCTFLLPSFSPSFHQYWYLLCAMLLKPGYKTEKKTTQNHTHRTYFRTRQTLAAHHNGRTNQYFFLLKFKTLLDAILWLQDLDSLSAHVKMFFIASVCTPQKLIC